MPNNTTKLINKSLATIADNQFKDRVMTCAERKAMKAKEHKQIFICVCLVIAFFVIATIVAIIILPKAILCFFMFPAFLIGALKAGANV